jgi:hypothetical protein
MAVSLLYALSQGYDGLLAFIAGNAPRCLDPAPVQPGADHS